MTRSFMLSRGISESTDVDLDRRRELFAQMIRASFAWPQLPMIHLCIPIIYIIIWYYSHAPPVPFQTRRTPTTLVCQHRAITSIRAARRHNATASRRFRNQIARQHADHVLPVNLPTHPVREWNLDDRHLHRFRWPRFRPRRTAFGHQPSRAQGSEGSSWSFVEQALQNSLA